MTSRPPRPATHFEHAVVDAIPAARVLAAEAVGVPQDRHGSAHAGDPLEQLQRPLESLGRPQPQVALLGQRRVHHRERELDQVERPILAHVVGTVREREAGPQADGVAVALAGVVGEAEPLELGQGRVGVVAQVVEPHPRDGGARQQLEPRPLLGDALGPLRRRVARVQADLVPLRGDLGDDRRPQPVVGRRVGSVGRNVLPGHHEVRRPAAVAALDGRDALVRPVGVGPAQVSHRRGREPERLGRGGAGMPCTGRLTGAGGGAEQRPRPAPAPGDVDVVRQGDRERRRAGVAHMGAELAQQAVDRRPLGVGERRRRREAAVLVAGRAGTLLPPRQVPERARHEIAAAVAEVDHAAVAQSGRRALTRLEVAPGPLRGDEAAAAAVSHRLGRRRRTGAEQRLEGVARLAGEALGRVDLEPGRGHS